MLSQRSLFYAWHSSGICGKSQAIYAVEIALTSAGKTYYARVFGAPATVVLNGLLCIAGTFYFAGHLKSLHQQVHPIYVRRGIITEENIRQKNIP
jgi:hypothetical protein